MIKKISHIGIAVGDLESARDVFRRILNLEPSATERVEGQKVQVSSFRLGESSIELTQATSGDSPIARFIEKRGEGIHHLAFEVDDIRTELRRLKEAGVQLIDEEPRLGADNCLVAFIHPRSANGVLVELCQKAEKA